MSQKTGEPWNATPAMGAGHVSQLDLKVKGGPRVLELRQLSWLGKEMAAQEEGRSEAAWRSSCKPEGRGGSDLRQRDPVMLWGQG